MCTKFYCEILPDQNGNNMGHRINRFCGNNIQCMIKRMKTIKNEKSLFDLYLHLKFLTHQSHDHHFDVWLQLLSLLLIISLDGVSLLESSILFFANYPLNGIIIQMEVLEYWVWLVCCITLLLRICLHKESIHLLGMRNSTALHASEFDYVKNLSINTGRVNVVRMYDTRITATTSLMIMCTWGCTILWSLLC